MDETKRVIRQNQEFLCNLELTPNLVDVAVESGLSGMTLKFLQESKKAGRTVRAEDYFGPYLTNLVAIIRARGLELYNENVDAVKISQPVIDDIMEQLQREKARFGERAKTYEALEHDMVLWHFVKSKRPTPVESPLQARYWIATVDYHFLGFDQFKRRNAEGEIPVCFHPAALIQMLQLWLPRTPQFEEAAMGSLRLPFLLGDFDPQAERVTIRILQALARFEGIEDLSQETIRYTLLNQALRQKLAVEGRIEQQVQLVREALFEEEKKIRAELEERRVEAESLRTQAEKKEQAITQLRQQFQDSQTKLNQERQVRQRLEERVKALEQVALDARRGDEARGQRLRFILLHGVVPLALITLLAFLSGLLVRRLTGCQPWLAATTVSVLLLVPALWLTDRSGLRNQVIREWSIFIAFHRFKRKLLGVLLATLIGVLANGLWDRIKPFFSRR